MINFGIYLIISVTFKLSASPHDIFFKISYINLNNADQGDI